MSEATKVTPGQDLELSNNRPIVVAEDVEQAAEVAAAIEAGARRARS